MTIALLAALALAHAPPRNNQENAVNVASLDDLSDAREFEVGGEATTSPLGGDLCVFYEWAVGEQDDQGRWTAWQDGQHSEAPVLVQAGGKQVEVSWRTLRLHLTPTTKQTWAGDEPNLPPWAAGWLDDHEGPAVVAEYCLRPGATYHGRVETETYSLPPRGPEGQPRTGRNTVLVLSDQPLESGEPILPRTPLYQGWSY